MKSRPHIYLATLILALAAVGWPPGDGMAAETSAVNPTGTWKVTYTHSGKSQAYQPTLNLKLEGDKLTGTLSRSHNQQIIEMVLEDVKLKASEISFMVSIPPESGNGPNFVKIFHGKFTGDMIKGSVDFPGQNAALDWEAKRVKK